MIRKVDPKYRKFLEAEAELMRQTRPVHKMRPRETDLKIVPSPPIMIPDFRKK